MIVPIYIILAQSVAMAEQTREQCNKCCKSTIEDEYYEEQCVLKCFRNHDHCTDAKGAKATERAEAVKPEKEKPAPQPRATQPSQPAQNPRESDSTRPAPPQHKEVRQPFKWPNPLNVVPGKEWEAAGQILIVNGIPPQHPNHQAALKAIEGVLVNFARANPSGGRLPTGQLERILKQYK